MDLELTGKRAIVTGGSRGIGLAIARALAAEGCDVALVAREPVALEKARDAVAAESGRRVIGVSADTGDDESVRAMVRAVADGLGGVDILVNAAAQPNTGAVVGVDGFDESEFSEQVNVKVLGYLRCIRGVVPLMRERGWGRIVNVSGLAARSTGSITGTVRTRRRASPSTATRSSSAAGLSGLSTTDRFGSERAVSWERAPGWVRDLATRAPGPRPWPGRPAGPR